jgi:lipopolysaccharide export system permease protein
VIIDRYIIREIFATLVAVTAVLLVIFLSNRYVQFLADASGGDLSARLVLKMLALKTLSVTVIILPMALFLAVLIGIGRLYKDSEMTAMAACGVSVRRVYRGVLTLALVVAAAVAAVSFYAAPWAEEQSYRIRDSERAHTELAGISPGRFTEGGAAHIVLYVESISEDGGRLRNVFVQQQGPGSQTILSAHSGFPYSDPDTHDQFLVLVDGYRYEGTPGSADFHVVTFREHAVRVDDEAVRPAYRKQRARATIDLLGSGDRNDIAELQWRLSMPVSVVLLCLLAVPLGRTSPRQGKYGKLFAAVLAYLIYSNLLGIANTWVARGVVPPLVGMWWVHALLVIAVVVLWTRQFGARWIFRAVLRRN